MTSSSGLIGQCNSAPPTAGFRWGVAVTPAASAGDRGVVAEQDHRWRRAGLVDQSTTASSSAAPLIHGAPADLTTRPPRPVIMAASPPVWAFAYDATSGSAD